MFVLEIYFYLNLPSCIERYMLDAEMADLQLFTDGQFIQA